MQRFLLAARLLIFALREQDGNDTVQDGTEEVLFEVGNLLHFSFYINGIGYQVVAQT